jgi:RNA polymerase primary sigma factor
VGRELIMATKTTRNEQNNLKYYFDEIKRNNLLSAEEEVELAKRIEDGDKTAFDKMVKCNLRLVVKIAKRYMTPEWQLSDLIQEGNIGLLKAVEKFDFRKNVRFSTYASWWIKQAIVRSIANKRRLIRLPHRKEEKLRKINRTVNELSQELKRNPSLKEVAETLGFNEKDVLNLTTLSEKMVSIDAEINENGTTIINLINDNHAQPEQIFDKHDLTKVTESILENLKEKEKQIIKSRFAFERRKKMTLKSLAREMGISPETVRQIEIKAIKKIKENYPYLKDYLYT